MCGRVHPRRILLAVRENNHHCIIGQVHLEHLSHGVKQCRSTAWYERLLCQYRNLINRHLLVHRLKLVVKEAQSHRTAKLLLRLDECIEAIDGILAARLH